MGSFCTNFFNIFCSFSSLSWRWKRFRADGKREKKKMKKKIFFAQLPLHSDVCMFVCFYSSTKEQCTTQVIEIMSLLVWGFLLWGGIFSFVRRPRSIPKDVFTFQPFINPLGLSRDWQLYLIIHILFVSVYMYVFLFVDGCLVKTGASMYLLVVVCIGFMLVRFVFKVWLCTHTAGAFINCTFEAFMSFK